MRKDEVKHDSVLLSLPSTSLLNARTAREHLPLNVLPSKDRQSHTAHWKHENRQTYTDHCPETTPASLLPMTSVQALTLILARWHAFRSLTPSTSAPSIITKLDTLLCGYPKSYPTIPLSIQLLEAHLSQTSNKDSPLVTLCQAIFQNLPHHASILCQRSRCRFERDVESIEEVVVRMRFRESVCAYLYLRQQKYPDILQISGITVTLTSSDFLWAWCGVNSRCIFLPLGLQPHADNFTLAPLLDMANHTMDVKRECKVRFLPGSKLELRAPKYTGEKPGAVSLKCGDEVLISYGPHSNKVSRGRHCWLSYLANSPFRHSLPSMDLLWEMTIHSLKSMSIILSRKCSWNKATRVLRKRRPSKSQVTGCE